MIKAVFFDFDGVLTTDPSGSYSTCKYLAKATDFDLDKILACYITYKLSLHLGSEHKDMWQNFCNALGGNLDISLLDRAFLSTPRNLQMFALVQKIHKKYKTAIITDNSKERINLINYDWEPEKLFDAVIISAEVCGKKNDKLIFKRALESLNVRPEESIFIDNKKTNLKVPNQMGIHTLFYDHEKNDVPTLEKSLRKIGCTI